MADHTRWWGKITPSLKNPVSAAAREAQADALDAKGYPEEADMTRLGLVEWDPDALEMLEDNPNA